MGPLPFRAQAGSLKSICARERFRDVRGRRDSGIWITNVPGVARELQHGPTIESPLDWGQNRDPPTGVRVRKSHVIPVTFLGLNDATLVWRSAARHWADHIQGELLHCVRAERACCGFQNILAVWRSGSKDIVIPVDFVEPRPFQDSDIGWRCEYLLCLHLLRAIRGELSYIELRVAIRNIHRVVIVNEESGVVVAIVYHRSEEHTSELQS